MGFTISAVLRRPRGQKVLGTAGVLTLYRASAAALACGTAFSGRGARAAWLAVLAGCTVSDWLDGPLARRAGTDGPLGAVLDLEADSWLTLWAAVAAARLGRLPPWAMLAPALRYPVVVGRRVPAPPRVWQRAAGVAQMAVLCAALGPWAEPSRAARAAAPLASAAQLAALLSGG